MDNKNLFLQGVTLAEFVDQLRQVIREEIANAKQKEPDEMLSPKLARQVFQPAISLVTLDAWAKQGRIKKHHIGKKVYYLRSELIEATKHLAPYKKSENAK